ncbi:hypothetical protein Sj15T_10610 [Sphingobium sp. TA15]|uniref:Uncharacterized protein n=1 Tax=Sphingobium indicum (strain DSM 16413 / CCM 7287 / MTCC 6362 / UT26 / NBRC 101211 / UT26S) TaxID=452662 RepID=D4Z8Y0_SPHIU|nr:hypothetical protein [Sphingobium indicum]BAI99062.1 hypothetical protein SJA_P1-01100 [Sphingobium indicum UT26S]BDD66040.1 hypothetical protein Sj15T_10610 [Sphingobium sp. TA15]
MRGILSGSPAPSAIRLLVGSHLLLLIQAGLVLNSRQPLDRMLAALVLMLAIVGLAALIAAIIGEPREQHCDPRRRYRHVR